MLEQERIDLALYRLERAKEALADAESMFEMGSLRSGNNRAYYAIFYAMRAVIALEGVDYKHHSGVIRHFQKDYIRTKIFPVEMADIINGASRIRNASDYDDFYIASKAETADQIEGAKLLIQMVENYISTTLRD